jgi:hypothetical protein
MDNLRIDHGRLSEGETAAAPSAAHWRRGNVARAWWRECYTSRLAPFGTMFAAEGHWVDLANQEHPGLLGGMAQLLSCRGSRRGRPSVDATGGEQRMQQVTQGRFLSWPKKDRSCEYLRRMPRSASEATAAGRRSCRSGPPVSRGAALHWFGAIGTALRSPGSGEMISLQWNPWLNSAPAMPRSASPPVF